MRGGREGWREARKEGGGKGEGRGRGRGGERERETHNKSPFFLGPTINRPHNSIPTDVHISEVPPIDRCRCRKCLLHVNERLVMTHTVCSYIHTYTACSSIGHNSTALLHYKPTVFIVSEPYCTHTVL